MNYRFVFNQFCALLVVLSIALSVTEVVFFIARALGDVDVDPNARLATMLVGVAGLVLGFFAWWLSRPKDKTLGRREALLLVAISWLFGAAFCALPYFVWAQLSSKAGPDHPFDSFVSCYFEAMSGLTTTGASVLSTWPDDIESLPQSILLWRSFTQWLGGLGIVVLFVAVLPTLGVGGRKLFRIEAPGPSPEGVTPHIRETARILWYLYLGFTVVEIGLLTLFGMRFFEAVCHSFTTLATGGFSTRNASVGAFPQLGITLTMIVFMIIAGTNFNIFYLFARGRWRQAIRDTELRVYLMVLGGAVVVIAASLMLSVRPIEMTNGDSVDPSLGVALREATFTATSVQTTTGFGTSDFHLYPFAAEAVILALMFIGGCAGSTGGGMKVIRVWIAFKVMIAEIEYIFRPKVVRPVRVAGMTIDDDLKLGTITYLLGFILLAAVGGCLVMLLEQGNVDPVTNRQVISYTTASTAAITCLCNVGPGFELVGPTGHFGHLGHPSQALLSVLMVIGRLEVFAILVLFTPRFWKRE